MSTRNKITADLIHKEREVLILRKDGMTFDQIAERLGYKNESGARAAYRRALLRTLQEPSEEMRELEVARLEDMHSIAWELMRNESLDPAERLAALDRVIKVQERRSRYLGLDAPKQSFNRVEVATYDGEIIDAQLIELRQYLGINGSSVLGEEGETGADTK